MRRRSLPNDLDVTAINDEEHGPDAETSVATEDDSAFTSAESTGASELDSFFEDAADTDDEVVPPAPPPKPVSGEELDSLFEDVSATPEDVPTGDKTMSPNANDLPADPTQAASTPPPAAPSMGADSDVLRIVSQLEGRMAQLEAKLSESNEARERLERQVAAQSEELRVQRAAIARTQRALRTMSRGDEDKATEPALRDGNSDTQTKTRVNV
jgi:hypothetical protein